MSRASVLITGVSSGVGASLARYLAGRYHVIGIARRLDVAAEALRGVPNVDLVGADLEDAEALDACLDLVADRFGPPANVINNAGVNHAAPIEALDPARLQASLQVNCLAPLAIMRRFLPAMVERDFGRIVNVTSGAPLNCFPGYAAYSASKAALNAVTVTAAREYQDRDIRINLLSPGPVRSNMAPNAAMDPSVCHPTVDFLLDPARGGPTGRFFWLGHEIPLFPDLDGVRWLEGTASERFPRIA